MTIRNDCFHQVQLPIPGFHIHYDDFGLKTNLKKTETVIWSWIEKSDSPYLENTIKLRNVMLENVKHFKYLGVYMKHFTWLSHWRKRSYIPDQLCQKCLCQTPQDAEKSKNQLKNQNYISQWACQITIVTWMSCMAPHKHWNFKAVFNLQHFPVNNDTKWRQTSFLNWLGCKRWLEI